MPRPVKRGGVVCLGWSERDLVNANTNNGPPLPPGAIAGIKQHINGLNQKAWIDGSVHITTCGNVVVDVWLNFAPETITCLECMST